MKLYLLLIYTEQTTERFSTNDLKAEEACGGVYCVLFHYWD